MNKDFVKVLGNIVNVAHAAKCGTCACRCACRFNVDKGKSPW